MRYKVVLAYDGTNYCGWQVQPNGISIQHVVEDVISSIQKVETHIEASGRTDAKVHAKGQVFHFDGHVNMTCEQWLKAMNAKLPEDMLVKEVTEVEDSFHSRFDAKWKNYDYYINLGEYDPFERNHVLQLCRPLDLDKMRECAKCFIGSHDFTAFNANSLQERPNQVRNIYDLWIEERGQIIVLHFYGEGFLRYMVRMITQTLIEVGKGRLSIEKVQELLQQAKKHSAPYNASAVGLYLVKVGYEDYKEE
ncbi:MAG: tRNA pseudouridine(38-40) synthase TruA [Erysipelotrichaceae bacterium]|nr:tRNA pseudouridine(38-40) synthase TruA [Erysipelotrichaceae bacterium]